MKINWKRVWAQNTKWFDAPRGDDNYPPSWEEQQQNIQALVERELKRKATKKKK